MNPFQLQLSKVFFMKSSGMTEQGSYWIPRKSERPLDRRVWVEADVEECWNKRKRAIGVRWVDVDKGFGVYRSRLVAKDFKPKSKVSDQEGLFAAHAIFGVRQDAYPQGSARKQKPACRCEEGHVPRRQ